MNQHQQSITEIGTILAEPFHFDCPFCLASIEVTAVPNIAEDVKVKCSRCQRKVEVPSDILPMLLPPDDDEDFLSGGPLKASGDEDVWTAADLAIETSGIEESEQSPHSAKQSNLLENEFEFAVVEDDSLAPQSNQDDDLQAEDEADIADDPETDLLLDGFHDKSKVNDGSKTGGVGDLNQLLAGSTGTPNPFVEKGSYGIRCPVCDSRIQVSLNQVATKIKCGDCYSMVTVRPPNRKEKAQIEKQIGLALDDSLQLENAEVLGDTEDDGELTLAPLEDDSSTEDELVEAEVVEELIEDDDDEPLRLREEPAKDPDEISGVQLSDDDFADVLLEDEATEVSPNGEPNEAAVADVVFDEEDDFPDDVVDVHGAEDFLAEDLSLPGPLDLEDASFVNPAELAAAAKKSKAAKEKQDGASEKDSANEKINPYRSKSTQQAKKLAKKNPDKSETENGYQPKKKKQGKAKTKLPEMRFDSFFSSAVELVTEFSVAVRGCIAAALLAIGNVISHSALSKFSAIEAPTMGDTATMGFWRFGVGWLPYAIGTILLWYFCGVVFRETARGKTKIKSWQLGATTEWTSTLLITAVSFAVAGAPVLMLMSIYITAPVRFFLALPFLTAVWYAQSPFAIISADVAVHFRKNGKHWKTVFLVVFAMASLAFVAGVLMHVPVPWLNILTSALGAVFLSFVTLAFAAVAGWHSGMVAEELS